jgi:hypothetical protein
MSEITLRIDKYLEGGGRRAPQVPARIYQIDPTSGSSASSGKAVSASVPISRNPAVAVHIQVAPGTYYVESILPSGETLTDSVKVGEGERRALVLRSETHSPNEWFSWQHLMGNTRPAASRPPITSKSAPRTVKKAVKVSRGRSGKHPTERSSIPRTSPALVGVPRIVLQMYLIGD